MQEIPTAGHRLPGLDGLRAVAVLLVMLIHVGLVGFGWIGVQIFFVLSGFLITRILIDSRARSENAGSYFRVFYLRRSLRIFPAYFAYLALVFVGLALTDPATWSRVQALAPWLLTYTYNFGVMVEEPARSMWVAHLWSLSIEEQFYLFWPLLIWLLPPRLLPRVALAIVIAGPVLRALIHLASPHLAPNAVAPAHTVYGHSLSHVDAFAMGALLCFPRIAQRAANLPSSHFLLLTLAAIGLGVLSSGAALLPPTANAWPLQLGFPPTLPQQGQWLWGYSAINLLSAILIAKIAYRGFGHGLFRHTAVDAFGRVSYGAYLIHHGIILWFIALSAPLKAWLDLPQLVIVVLWFPFYVLTVYALAWLSFRYFETPLLRLKDRYEIRPGTAPA